MLNLKSSQFFMANLPVKFCPLVLAVILGGCAQTVYLMPTPIVLQSGEIEANSKHQADQSGNIVSVFYATNRFPNELRVNTLYSTEISDNLRFGQANVRIGEKGKTWGFLKSLSTTGKRDQQLKLTLDQSIELGRLKPSSETSVATDESGAFIATVNRALSENESKNITVYVHGATANFESTMAQAAQIRHFTGYSQLVLAFSWPTAENFLFYGTDVENAKKSAPTFVRLLQFLAQHTDVEAINILAYSSGGQVTSLGLDQLGVIMRNLSPEAAKKQLKLAEIYFAAPDVELKTFVEQIPSYIKLVDSTTIAMNPNDFVLSLSSFHQGTVRLGRPEDSVLTESQIQWLNEASTNGTLHVIRILPEILTDYDSGAHDFWFSHPWVSTDMLIQMLFRVTPEQRGLKAEITDSFRWWHFPEDYPQNITPILKELDR